MWWVLARVQFAAPLSAKVRWRIRSTPFLARLAALGTMPARNGDVPLARTLATHPLDCVFERHPCSRGGGWQGRSGAGRVEGRAAMESRRRRDERAPEPERRRGSAGRAGRSGETQALTGPAAYRVMEADDSTQQTHTFEVATVPDY